jgi:hypothetical protein
MYVRTGSGFKREDDESIDITPMDTPIRTFQSHSDDTDSQHGRYGTCIKCGQRMRIIEAGQTTHPACDAA